jgi:dihydrofolate reductase
MWNIITLDGYFEGKEKWDLSFHESIWGPELEKLSIEQLRSAGYLVFGRVTFEGMAAYWKNAKNENNETVKLMNSVPKLAFSRKWRETDLEAIGWNNSTLVKGSASEELSKLKAQGEGDVFVFGSADLARTFIDDDLIDEYRIGMAPVILGKGTPLFKPGMLSKNLKLISAKTLSTGGVVLTFGK